MNIILIILVFGVIVFFHELGHFLVAKLNKISVAEFSIGLGPAIFSKERKGTKYSLRLLPLGGYCMMVGEENASEDENAFNNQPVWVRMMVMAAGPLFNFLLAFLFGIVLVHYAGCDPAVLSKIAPNSAAQEAGLCAGDEIIKINGKRIYNFRELPLHLALMKEGEPIELTMERPDGTRYETVAIPKEENGSYYLGVESKGVLADGPLMTIKYAALECRYWAKTTIMSLRMIVTGKVKSTEIMGPVGVGQEMNNILDEVKDVSETKKDYIINMMLNLMNWCILLSVNLGIMNLLPIPALDGGRLLFLIIEAVTRRKIPQEKENIVNLIGFVILFLIMILVFFNDIKNVFF